MSALSTLQQVVTQIKQTGSIAAEVELDHPLSQHGFNSTQLNEAVARLNQLDGLYVMRSRSQDGEGTRVVIHATLDGIE